VFCDEDEVVDVKERDGESRFERYADMSGYEKSGV
jgi:hypothetical protein